MVDESTRRRSILLTGEARGGEPGGGAGAKREAQAAVAAAPYLVDREQCYPPTAAGGLGDAANERRRQRFERRQQSSEWLIHDARVAAGLPASAPRGTSASDPGWVRPARLARCRWRVAPEVGVHSGGDRGAHFSGLERCASIWACPVCAAVIRHQRSEEIQQAVTSWQATGKALAFVTLTMRHQRDDRLGVTLDAALKAWRRLLQGKSWRIFRDRWGIKGYIRAVEVTLGAHGWHPHLHVLFFIEQPLSDSDVQAWSSGLYSRWAEYVTSFGGGLPTLERGVDVRPADQQGTVVGQYLAKFQDEGKATAKRRGVGQELARFDFKTGRGSSLMPFELLDLERRADASDDDAAHHLWSEYVRATHGRRALTWSRGLRDLVNLQEERSDEEVLQDTQAGQLRFLIPGPEYDRHLKNEPAVMAKTLEAVEAEQIALAVQLSGGYMPPELIDMLTGESVVLGSAVPPPGSSPPRPLPVIHRRSRQATPV